MFVAVKSMITTELRHSERIGWTARSPLRKGNRTDSYEWMGVGPRIGGQVESGRKEQMRERLCGETSMIRAIKGVIWKSNTVDSS